MPYNFHWNSFPSDLADVKDALPLLLDLYRGKEVARDDAALAVFNGAGFVYATVLSNSERPPMFSPGATADPQRVEAAFAEAIAAADEPSAMRAGPAVASPWIAILAPVILDLFRKWLKF